MLSEEYTEKVEKLAQETIDKLKELSALLESGGEVARAMDVNEAIDYVEEAVERE